MITLFVQNNIQKIRMQNTQWKQRYRWKRYRSKTQRNGQHFPPASGRMTPNSVCLWCHREHGDSNKRWRQRRFEPSQKTGVKKMINGNVSSEFISLWIASVHGAASSIQSCVSPLVLRLQKWQDVQSHNVTSGLPSPRTEVTISVREYPENNQISNFKRHFLENDSLYHREILHDNSEDQAQWHIPKLCSFL